MADTDTAAADPSSVNDALTGKAMGSPLDKILSERKTLEKTMKTDAAGEEAGLKADREKLAKFDATHPFPHPDVKPWTEKPPENDPVKSFGSWASTLGILASALTKTPLASALNASASAMKAIRADDLNSYAEAKDAWQKNTDIAIKNAEWEVKGYQDAMDLMDKDIALGQAAWKAHAAATGNQAALLLGDAGIIEHQQQMSHSMSELTLKLKQAQPELQAEADRQQAILGKVDEAKKAAKAQGIELNPQQLAQIRMKARNEIAADEARAKMLGTGGRPTMANEQALMVEDLVAKGVSREDAIRKASEASERTPRSTSAMLLQQWRKENPNATAAELAAKQADINSQQKAVAAFGASKEGDTVRSMDVSISHMAALKDYADALDNGDVTRLNQVRNYMRDEFGWEAPATFDDARQFVTDEAVKAIIGTGGGVTDRANAQASLSSAQSPAKISSILDERTRLMAGQLNGLERQYKRTTHDEVGFDDRWLSPTSQEAFKKYRTEGGGPVKAQHKVGDIVEHGGKKYRVTGGDPTDPDVEEVK